MSSRNSRSSSFSSTRPGSLVNHAQRQLQQMRMINQLAYGRPRPSAQAMRNYAAQQRRNQLARMPNRRPTSAPLRRAPSLSRRVNAQTAYIGNVHSSANQLRNARARNTRARPAVPQRNVVFRNGKWQWTV